MSAIEHCGSAGKNQSLLVWGGHGQAVNCLQHEAVLICNYLGEGGGCFGLSKLERSSNDITEAIAFHSQIVIPTNGSLGFLH